MNKMNIWIFHSLEIRIPTSTIKLNTSIHKIETKKTLQSWKATHQIYSTLTAWRRGLSRRISAILARFQTLCKQFRQTPIRLCTLIRLSWRVNSLPGKSLRTALLIEGKEKMVTYILQISRNISKCYKVIRIMWLIC